MAPRPRQFKETATPSARSPAGGSPRRPLEGDLAGKVQVLASDPKDGLAALARLEATSWTPRRGVS